MVTLELPALGRLPVGVQVARGRRVTDLAEGIVKYRRNP